MGFDAVYYPSLRSLLLSNSGQTDGELHRIKNFHGVSDGKYPNLIRIDSEILTVWLGAFTLENKEKITELDDIKTKKVAFYLGRKNVEQMLKQLMSPDQFFAVKSDEQALNMLLKGRVDIVIAEKRSVGNLIKNNTHFSDIELNYVVSETPIYSYMHKKHGAIITLVSDQIELMRADGRLKTITDNINESF
ncbi:MAG: transporter substrate-binding domain-containing protein [Saccharospirillaceae bacterium]|nr:transporter substrate-binding domain-containing protein [Pseudomonadales bacterium]NRB79131.1 transporter substrate-binding domain-containing protein [Saccharospirillaceae bacterium]